MADRYVNYDEVSFVSVGTIMRIVAMANVNSRKESDVLSHIRPTPEEIQKIIGGYIEQFTIADDLLALCNGEGWLRTLKPCCTIGGVTFAGTVILCGKRRATYSDIPVSLEELRILLPSLWENQEKGENRWKTKISTLKTCSKS